MDNIGQVVRLCLETHFALDDRISQQSKRTPMKSQIFCAITELEWQLLKYLAIEGNRPNVWVDDTVVNIERNCLADSATDRMRITQNINSNKNKKHNGVSVSRCIVLS